MVAVALRRWAAGIAAAATAASAAAASARCEAAGGCRRGGEDAAMLQAVAKVHATAELEEASGAAAFEALVLERMARGLNPGVLSGSLARRAAEDLTRRARERGVEPPELDAEEVALPWTLGVRPLAQCGEAAATGEAEESLARAVRVFCDAGLGEHVEFYVDLRYKDTHDRLRSADGWIDRAYMTYYGMKDKHSNISGMEDMLLQSLHHFSDKPVVVINFGNLVPRSWSPERYPNMVLMHAKKSTARKGVSFNMNKLTAMLFTKIRTGIQLDGDEWANRGLDVMFQRAEEEITKDYPYPILPVHWMSRDTESSDMKGLPKWYAWSWKNPDMPKQTMRWSHSHPTWTHYALPWIAKWASLVLAPEATNAPQWLRDQGHWSDEPILNVGAWADGATKQWCKFDIPSPGTFKYYVQQQIRQNVSTDSKYYPKGIAYMYFSAHGAKDPQDSYEWMQSLWNSTAGDSRMLIAYDGKWFKDAAELRAYDPNLRCIV